MAAFLLAQFAAPIPDDPRQCVPYTPPVPEPSLDPQLAGGLSPSVIEGLEKWQLSTGHHLSFEAWLTAGNTKAVVAAVVVTGAGPPQKVILKACPPDRQTAREPRLHAQALAESPPEFASRHLVEQPFDGIECADKWRVLFQSVAGDSLRQMRPLESMLHDDSLPEIVESIGSAILHKWNPKITPARTTPPELLQAELGSKVERRGPLAKFVEDLGLADDLWIRFADTPASVLPNAVAWSLDPLVWPNEIEPFWAVFGRSHGDLHPGNLLIRVAPTPRPDDFRIIDLSAFSSDGSLDDWLQGIRAFRAIIHH